MLKISICQLIHLKLLIWNVPSWSLEISQELQNWQLLVYSEWRYTYLMQSWVYLKLSKLWHAWNVKDAIVYSLIYSPVKRQRQTPTAILWHALTGPGYILLRISGGGKDSRCRSDCCGPEAEFYRQTHRYVQSFTQIHGRQWSTLSLSVYLSYLIQMDTYVNSSFGLVALQVGLYSLFTHAHGGKHLTNLLQQTTCWSYVYLCFRVGCSRDKYSL